jgi:hypothetical protein
MGPETNGSVCNHCLDLRGKMRARDDRALIFERVDGLLALRRTERCSKETEFSGFLAIFHPELGEDRRAQLAREMAKKDES